MIIIELFVEEKLIAKAKYVKLDSCSTSLLRRFSFHNVKIKQKEFLQVDYDKLLDIRVYFIDKKKKKAFCVGYFELIIASINYPNAKVWEVEGTVVADKEKIPSFSQGMLDVCSYWQQGKELQWYNLPEGISTMDYICACLSYSSISEITPEKEVVEIDFRYVKTELEFTCCFAEEFMGVRSYMGRYLDTFEDCLVTLYMRRKRYFDDKKVIFKCKDVNVGKDLLLVINEAERRLRKYKFNIETVM